MDISPFEIYLTLQADALVSALQGVAISALLSFILWAVFGTMAVCEEAISARSAKWLGGSILAVVVVSGLGSAFVPRTNTLVAMFGLPAAIDAVSKLEGTEQIPQNTVDALNRLLEGVGKE